MQVLLGKRNNERSERRGSTEEKKNFVPNEIFKHYLYKFPGSPKSPPAAHTKMVKIGMDRFSDDEALERKEDSEKELETKREEISKCKLIEELGEMKEDMKKNREVMEESFRQLSLNVIGTGYESKVEEIRKFVRMKCVFEEVRMRKKYEEAKKTWDDKVLTEIHKEAIEIEKAQKESIMQGVEMIQRLGKEKQGEDIESRLKAKVEELDAERKEKENKEKWELVEKIEKIKEDLIENRENVEVFLRLADTYEKGIEEENKIEEIRKFVKKNSKYLEELMIKKIKEVKETGKELGSDTIENSSWMIDSYKKKIDRCKRELEEIIR